MDANTATVLVAGITALGTAVNILLNRHTIKQNNELKDDTAEIKGTVNGNTQQLQDQLNNANKEIARLNRRLTVRGDPDRRQVNDPNISHSER